jgi:hypothetical protein
MGQIDYYAGGWSPDGTKFVYQRRYSRGNAAGNLYVVDTKSGRAKRIPDITPQETKAGWWYLEPTFSPDSQHVIFQTPQVTPSSERFALWSVPVTGGEPPTLLFRNAAQAATSEHATYGFARPIGHHFLGSRLVLATPHGVRTLVEATGGNLRAQDVTRWTQDRLPGRRLDLPGRRRHEEVLRRRQRADGRMAR